MQGDREAIIDAQNEQYRRGQILGFTMAEIMLVLLFLLLLILGSRVKQLVTQLDTYIQPEGNQHEALRLMEDTVVDLQAAGLMDEDQDELWLSRKLTLVADRILQDQRNWSQSVEEAIEKLGDDLRAERMRNRELQDVLDNLREDNPDKLAGAEMLASLEENNLSFEEAKVCLKSCGGGPEACWGESLRSPDYIYNVAIYDDFVRVEPDMMSVEKNFASWRSLPVAARVENAQSLSIPDFRARFGRLLEHSRDNDCVFQVRLYDADTSSKEIYKDRRRLVEGYVYPTPIESWPSGQSSPD